MRLRVVGAAALVCAAMLTAALAAQVPDAAETFDKVWTIVHDTHFDSSFDEAAWSRTRDELRPKALAAKTPGDLRAVLRDMLGRLGLSHFAIIPATPDNAADKSDLSGYPGLDVRLIDHELIVTSVTANDGAAAAGVHPGWRIDRIGETPAAALLAGVEGSPPRLAQLEAWRRAQTKLRGPAGSSVQVGFTDGAGAAVTKSIARKPEEGQPVTVGALPTMFVRVDAVEKKTPGGATAGVIAFNVWMTAVDAPFQQAMDRFRHDAGIIIDLRGNPGGLAIMISGIAGHFTATPETLGVMKTRDTELHFVSNPRLVNAAGERVEPFAGPVAIIVDGMTGSASECFAGGMQSLGRARVFGQTSMGQALPALFDKLPNGDVMIHAWGDFVTGTGVRIEGRGVIPDAAVAVTRQALLAGEDPSMAAALAWIDGSHARL